MMGWSRALHHVWLAEDHLVVSGGRRQGRLGDIWHLYELFVNIQRKQDHLWTAVDQDGDVIDILVQWHRYAGAAKRFFHKL